MEPRLSAMQLRYKEGSHEVAPNSANEGRDCFVNTIPVTNPVIDISASDLNPTS